MCLIQRKGRIRTAVYKYAHILHLYRYELYMCVWALKLTDFRRTLEMCLYAMVQGAPYL